MCWLYALEIRSFPGGSMRIWAETKLCYLIYRPINGSSDEMSWPCCEYGTRFYVTVRQINNYHHNDSLLVSSIFPMKDLELIPNIRNCHDIQEEITQCVLFILIISWVSGNPSDLNKWIICIANRSVHSPVRARASSLCKPSSCKKDNCYATTTTGSVMAAQSSAVQLVNKNCVLCRKCILRSLTISVAQIEHFQF